jgi:proteasome accessory factor A
MAIPTVMGTEIEFGIMVKNDPDFDPISSCVLIVNAYREDPNGHILWDYDQENPLADARGFQVEGEKYTPNQQENIARNKTLINGARFYVDHAHPEYSSPEVTNARDLVIHEKAGERIIEISRREANQLLPAGAQMLIYKNNSDRKGNSYGCHENYLMDRRTSFKQVVEPLLPFFSTRQIWCGAGKVGSENRSHPCDYQLSQRADFFETEVALPDRQHAGRAARGPGALPPAARDRGRLQYVGIHDLPAQWCDCTDPLHDRRRRDHEESVVAGSGSSHSGGLARSLA